MGPSRVNGGLSILPVVVDSLQVRVRMRQQVGHWISSSFVTLRAPPLRSAWPEEGKTSQFRCGLLRPSSDCKFRYVYSWLSFSLYPSLILVPRLPPHLLTDIRIFFEHRFHVDAAVLGGFLCHLSSPHCLMNL